MFVSITNDRLPTAGRAAFQLAGVSLSRFEDSILLVHDIVFWQALHGSNDLGDAVLHGYVSDADVRRIGCSLSSGHGVNHISQVSISSGAGAVKPLLMHFDGVLTLSTFF